MQNAWISCVVSNSSSTLPHAQIFFMWNLQYNCCKKFTYSCTLTKYLQLQHNMSMRFKPLLLQGYTHSCLLYQLNHCSVVVEHILYSSSLFYAMTTVEDEQQQHKEVCNKTQVMSIFLLHLKKTFVCKKIMLMKLSDSQTNE